MSNNFTKNPNFIIVWLKNYINENPSVKGFVVGVSGGVDSALVSTLCAKTNLPTTVIEMPIHQNEEHVSRAQNHINWLKENFSNVSSLKIDLTKTFDVFVDEIKDSVLNVSGDAVYSEEKNSLGESNSRSRLRMIALYQVATLQNSIVVGTGNKVEDFGVGFFTKYGDGGVDISPIGDLLKTEVWQMAEELGISKEIINAAPSDGLWSDSRTDEQQIGATYKELEEAMKNIELKNENLTDREKEVVEILNTRNRNNRHKMIPIPVCVYPKLKTF